MKTRILLMIALVFLNCSISAQENKASVALTTAIYEEEVTGNLDKAVELYLDILKKYPDDRPVAAKALYHLGLVNEKMGKQKATEYFTRLVNTYPDQIAMVALAKTKLAALDTTTAARSTGITIRQVWAGPGVDTYGAPSPDGRYISYVDWERSDINHNDLAIYEIATGKKRRLTNNASWDEPGEYQCAYYSRWSPDGKQIVYVWYNGEGYYELRIIGIDGSKPRILFRNEEVEWARTYDWSPDGKQILACFDKKDGSDQMVLVSVADGSVCVLKILEQGWPNNMNFSPDGRYIMYDYPQKENSPERDINLLLIDESREIPLVEHPADDFVLGWAPDGKNILFASDRTGTLGTWLIAVADGKPKGAPELVNPDIGRFIPLGFTQKGSFYYGISKGRDDVYIAELNTKTGKILSPPNKTVTRSEGFNIASEYSPDGKYLAYIYNLGFLSTHRHRHPIICISNLKTGEDSEFSFNLDYIIRHCSPRWSPDCLSILVSGNNNWNGNGIYKIDIQTGEVTCIVQNGHSGVWSPDGKSIFFVREDSKAEISQIFVRDLENGKEKELYQSASNDYIPYNISLAPDGQSLALRCLRPTSLKVMPTTGGEPRELPEFDKMATIHKPIAWTADGRYIIFSGKNPGGEGHPLYRISVESGKIDRLGLNISRYHSLSVHPDGIHIAISCWGPTPKSDEVWVMENFLTETKAEQ
jgi:Tol biopolymer transport system component